MSGWRRRWQRRPPLAYAVFAAWVLLLYREPGDAPGLPYGDHRISWWPYPHVKNHGRTAAQRAAYAAVEWERMSKPRRS